MAFQLYVVFGEYKGFLPVVFCFNEFLVSPFGIVKSPSVSTHVTAHTFTIVDDYSICEFIHQEP